MNKRELGKALRESQWVPEMIAVHWSRNSPSGIQTGVDLAWTPAEAYKLAEARVTYGGIPGAASIYHNGVEIRRYYTDHAGRSGYLEQPNAVTF